MKLSIITINLNNAEGLRHTIESVRAQTWRDFEHIIIDGGSTDGSLAIIEEFADGFSCWVSEPDKGIYNAQNKGMRKARGEYLLFLNSGDFLFAGSTLADIFRRDQSADIVYGDMIIDNGDGNTTHGRQPSPMTLSRLVGYSIWHPASLVRLALIKRMGGYREDLRIVADYEFFLRALLTERATLEYAPVVFSVFNTQGICSSPVASVLHQEERSRVQREHLHPMVMELLADYQACEEERERRKTDWLYRALVRVSRLSRRVIIVLKSRFLS